ncbi:MAG: dihydropteroate synthase [Microthrixaceae bacterium]|nr:dihydropteroate synthase [Microthrixaceae bacterium]
MTGPRGGGGSVPSVMGILNITPDSFSDGGRNLDPRAALGRAEEMVTAGVGFIDVGGESTRPGADAVDPREEQRRVLPVIEAVAPMAGRHGVRVSIDTRNASTAAAAVGLGATVINDVSSSLWHVAAETGVGWVAMHMLGDPRTMQRSPRYGDVLGEVRAYLDERAGTAERAGVQEVWVDPGIGFGKTTSHNLSLLAGIDRIVSDGRPVLIGTSRKRSLGELLAKADSGVAQGLSGAPGEPAPEPVPVEDRLEGSLASAVWAMIGGVEVVRAHDISATVGAIEALWRTRGSHENEAPTR